MLIVWILFLLYYIGLWQNEDVLTEVFWDQILTVVHDEYSPHIQLDVVLLLLVLKQVKWRPLWYKQECTELQLTFH